MRRRNKPKAFKKQGRSPISIQANLHTAKLQETGFTVCRVKSHHRSLSIGQWVWDPAHTQERSEQRLLRAPGERGPVCGVAAPVSLCAACAIGQGLEADSSDLLTYLLASHLPLTFS